MTKLAAFNFNKPRINNPVFFVNFTKLQLTQALIYLSFFHIFIITISNYLVQFYFTIGFIHNTYGAFTFPFIFLTTDLTVRIFGKHLARKIIFIVMIPALLISYTVSVLFVNGNWAGWHLLYDFNTFVFRIALASFSGYAVGQILDIYIFNRLRMLNHWWLAPSASTLLGSLIDSLVFFFVAFYKSSDAFLAANWFHLGCVDYFFKLIISGLFFLPTYGLLLNYLTKKLTTTRSENNQKLESK